jgi:hypothetical protein
MLRGSSLQELAAKIEAKQNLKRDLIANTSAVTMRATTDRATALEVEGEGSFPILPLAHTQISTRLNIPAKYYNRMQAEAPTLLAANVNEWFRKKPERRMLRTMEGELRAFLSNRYARTENEEIASTVLPILFELPNVQIPSCEVTDKRLYIHFTVPGVRGEVKVGDFVQAGGIVTNSEVGCGAISVKGLLWRLRCLNGMTTSDAYRRAHIGREVEDTGEIEWVDDTRRSDDATILLKVRDMVRAVLDEARFKTQIDKLKELAGVKVTGNPEKAVEALAAKVGANDGERGGILRVLIDGGDLSAWGLINAVTAQAHEAADYDRAVEWENAGGALIGLPAPEWRRLLEAA